MSPSLPEERDITQSRRKKGKRRKERKLRHYEKSMVGNTVANVRFELGRTEYVRSLRKQRPSCSSSQSL